MKRRAHRILLVDDDFDEQFLTLRALNAVLNGCSTVNLASSGDEAIAYMIGEGRFADRTQHPFPTFVLTDLNMQPGDGFDVLEFMQSNPGWSVVPRILFSTSEDDDDVRTAYRLGATVYHLKPSAPDELEKRMREIVAYWASSVVPPVDVNGRLITTECAGRRGARYPQPAAGDVMRRPSGRSEGRKIAGPVPRPEDHPRGR